MLAVDKRAAALNASDQGPCTRRLHARLHLEMVHQAYQADDKLGQAEQVSAIRQRAVCRHEYMVGGKMGRSLISVSRMHARAISIDAPCCSTGPLQVGGGTKTARLMRVLQPLIGSTSELLEAMESAS